MPKRRVPPPALHAEVAKRRRVKPSSPATAARVPLLDVPLKGLTEVSMSMEGGRLRVVGDVGVRGLGRRRSDGLIPATRLTQRDVVEVGEKELGGAVPAGVPTSFVPRKARPTHRLPDGRGTDVDRGGTIFDTDDRYLFDDTSFPWRTTGKVRTEGQWGSGTTIGPRLVLTASHVINWTGSDEGGVSWVTFTPGYFDGSGPWGEIAATHVIYWIQAPGTLSDEQTAFDYVVLVMSDRIGDVVGYPGYRTYDERWNGESYWQYIGYPGELASGERPAFQGEGVVSSVGDHSTSGQTGYVMGHFNEFTPGQSGGITWGWWGEEPWPRVVGVGSTIGSTAVQTPSGTTTGDNEYGGGPALSALIGWARTNFA
jgi:V8-like Glu-specific endopeptidase